MAENDMANNNMTKETVSTPSMVAFKSQWRSRSDGKSVTVVGFWDVPQKDGGPIVEAQSEAGSETLRLADFLAEYRFLADYQPLEAAE